MIGFYALGQQALAASAGRSQYVMLASTGTFEMSGQAAALKSARFMSLAAGSFTVSWGPVEGARDRAGLSISSGGGVRGLQASAGGGGRGLRIRA